LKEKHDDNSSEMEESEDYSKNSDANSSDESYRSDDESESISPSTELVEKIHELVFSKIEMPSSSSNKSIIGSLEYIETLIEKIDQNEIYGVSI
jgi:hypothetical protein